MNCWSQNAENLAAQVKLQSIRLYSSQHATVYCVDGHMQIFLICKEIPQVCSCFLDPLTPDNACSTSIAQPFLATFIHVPSQPMQCYSFRRKDLKIFRGFTTPAGACVKILLH
ncbi:hypothetical protein OsJ_04132 [Oryza sativa Japonica Group]|uniref:Uncharacterized protein n=1 Tax=Oryza sativa subsp. japonica TaxID=39947 RepID=B9EUS5_ORYSJ|nr:hypothetical protein OsJ_04132 [Oryza sativa Japonica Group]